MNKRRICLDGLKLCTCTSSFADSSRTVPVMYGAALGLPQPLLQDHDKAERKKEIETQTQVNFFRYFRNPSVWSFRTIAHQYLTRPSENRIHFSALLHLMSVIYINLYICYQLSTPSWDPWSSVRSSKTSSPKESSRPKLSCCLAQGKLLLPLVLWCWPQLLEAPAVHKYISGSVPGHFWPSPCLICPI